MRFSLVALVGLLLSSFVPITFPTPTEASLAAARQRAKGKLYNLRGRSRSYSPPRQRSLSGRIPSRAVDVSRTQTRVQGAPAAQATTEGVVAVSPPKPPTPQAKASVSSPAAAVMTSDAASEEVVAAMTAAEDAALRAKVAMASSGAVNGSKVKSPDTGATAVAAAAPAPGYEGVTAVAAAAPAPGYEGATGVLIPWEAYVGAHPQARSASGILYVGTGSGAPPGYGMPPGGMVSSGPGAPPGYGMPLGGMVSSGPGAPPGYGIPFAPSVPPGFGLPPGGATMPPSGMVSSGPGVPPGYGMPFAPGAPPGYGMSPSGMMSLGPGVPPGTMMPPGTFSYPTAMPAGGPMPPGYGATYGYVPEAMASAVDPRYSVYPGYGMPPGGVAILPAHDPASAWLSPAMKTSHSGYGAGVKAPGRPPRDPLIEMNSRFEDWMKEHYQRSSDILDARQPNYGYIHHMENVLESITRLSKEIPKRHANYQASHRIVKRMEAEVAMFSSKMLLKYSSPHSGEFLRVEKNLTRAYRSQRSGKMKLELMKQRLRMAKARNDRQAISFVQREIEALSRR